MYSSPDMFYAPYGAGMADGVGIAAVLGALVVLYVIFAVLAVALSVVSYVFHSLGLYTIGTRRGIQHSWLAWLPIGNLWVLGSIADQYQYVAKGKIRSRRKVMLGLSIAAFAVELLCIVGVFVFGIAEELHDGEMAAGPGLVVLLVFAVLAVVVLAIVLAVFQYISYYSLFASSSSRNAELFLVLGILFPVTLPFFVFACRKKDEGMPPRRATAQAEPVSIPEQSEENPVQPVEEGYAQPEEFEQ